MLNKIVVLCATSLLAGCGQAPATDNVSAEASPEAVTVAARDFTNVDALGAMEAIQNIENLVVLDVRTPEEFADGHIDGAININFYDDNFREQLEALDKSVPYLLHCRSGNRSNKALKIMRALGFQKVIHLDGGILAWNEAGLPLTQ